MKFLRFVQALIFVGWLGGMIFFGFVVAPTAFSALPSTHLAGEMVGESLRKLNLISEFCLCALLLSAFLAPLLLKRKLRFSERFFMLLVLVALVVAVYSQLGIDRRLHQIRIQAGVIDTLPPNDPLVIEFNQLHRRSVKMFGTNLVVGLLMLGLWVKDQ